MRTISLVVRATRTISTVLFAVGVVFMGYTSWEAYEDYVINRGSKPLRELMKAEMQRFEAAKKSKTPFEPSSCSGSCAQEFLEKYTGDGNGELTFMLRGHSDLAGKTVRYKPIPAGTADGIEWVCKTSVSCPVSSHFPICDRLCAP